MPLKVMGEGEGRSEEHTSELPSRSDVVCRLRLEKKKEERQVSRMEGGDAGDGIFYEDSTAAGRSAWGMRAEEEKPDPQQRHQ